MNFVSVFLVAVLLGLVEGTTPTVLGSCPPGPSNVFPVEVSTLPCVADSVTICNSTCTTVCESPSCTAVCPTGGECDEIPWCAIGCDTGGDFADACPTCDLTCCPLTYIGCLACNITCEAPNCFYNCAPNAACVTEAAGSTITCEAPTCSLPGASSGALSPLLMMLVILLGLVSLSV
jgi:hypothetical protein